MAFKKNSTAFKVFGLVRDLPYFSIVNLTCLGIKAPGLKILLHRLAKRGDIIPLKKGLYVSRSYVDNLQKKGKYEGYLEFIGGIIYSPSYLSLEYILSSHNILTEFAWGLTFVTRNKTKRFANDIGAYSYRHLSDKLFCGFTAAKTHDFTIYKASPAKALFDFIYLRKNSLINAKTVKELRLNLDVLNSKDVKEFKKYISLEGSKKMKQITLWLFKGKK